MKPYSLFISSSDTYADIWPEFFGFFRKFWPEFNGTIYLNTENLDFQFEGLDIRCTKVGHLGTFGKVFRAGLAQVDSEYVLLIMIDYFFMGQVGDKLIDNYFEAFIKNELDSLCLVPQRYRKTKPLGLLDLDLVIPPSKDMFSYQIAFWKKKVLIEMALPHESPWLSEWYGTARANQMGLRLAFPRQTIAIPYLLEGALHKGKWVAPMVEFLKDANCPVDFSMRGHFIEAKATLLGRIKARYQTFWPRLLSRFDLLKRQIF